MTLVPIDLPAGVYKNGTDLEGQGRWQDASLVRWRDNTLRPVGGWTSRIGAELVSNGDFSTIPDTSWTAATGWTISSSGTYPNTATHNYPSATTLTQDISVIPAEHRITFDVGGLGESNTIRVRVGEDIFGPDEVIYLSEEVANGSHSFDFDITAAGTVTIMVNKLQTVTPEWYIDNISLKQKAISVNPIRGFHTWEANDGSRFYAGGSYNELRVATSNNMFYDITPTGLTAGDEHSTLETGYGYGNYGVGAYGVERSEFGSYSEANTWSLDNWGEYLIACSYADGKLYEWQLNTSSDAAQISNAPIGNLGAVVTEERIIFALGAGNNPRKVQWCDIEDNTAWTPTSANQAGDIELQTAGQIMQGIRTRGQVLILTDIDAHSARYSGPPFIYGFQRVGTACGAISRAAAVDTDAGVFWMGQRGFFRFDGNIVQEVPCDVFDHVFGEIQDRNKSKTWAWNNSEFGEVWWFYQSEAQTDTGEIDKYVAYDFKENHWHIGSLSRTAGAPRGVFRHPLLLDSTDVYQHEISGTGATNMFAETGPIQLGNGDNILHVTQMIADERTKGDVQVKFKTRFYPNSAETEHGPFNPATPTGLRFAGRQFKMRVEPDDGSEFRLGIVRVDAQQGGKR